MITTNGEEDGLIKHIRGEQVKITIINGKE